MAGHSARKAALHESPLLNATGGTDEAKELEARSGSAPRLRSATQVAVAAFALGAVVAIAAWFRQTSGTTAPVVPQVAAPEQLRALSRNGGGFEDPVHLQEHLTHQYALTHVHFGSDEDNDADRSDVQVPLTQWRKGHWDMYENMDFKGGDMAYKQVRTPRDQQILVDSVEERGWFGFVLRGDRGIAKGGKHGPHSVDDLVPTARNESTRFYVFVEEPPLTPAPTPAPPTPAPPTPAPPTPAPAPVPMPMPPSFNAEPVCGDGADTRTMYMYRSQSDNSYPMENVNAADLPGVLWYLHHEVVKWCPRRNHITRILRLKVTMRHFASFVAFDEGATGNVEVQRKVLPGCQQGDYAGWGNHWYSLPGKCPRQKLWEKYEGCDANWEEAGGYCGCDKKIGEQSCHYHYEYAGEINLNELQGIVDYGQFCAAGGEEYQDATDTGVNNEWWTGFHDHDKALWRINQVYAAFHSKYPDAPVTLGSNDCE